MKFLITAILLQLFSIPATLSSRFDEFLVTDAFKGKPGTPLVSRPEERRFRTVIREGAKQGPNFAGHYTIVEWGCGTECIQAAVVDSRTGTVFQPPFGQKGDRYFATTWLHFKLGSRLILACTNCRRWAREDCDQHYFVWSDDRWSEVRRSPLRDPHTH
jgi:hypothetical protein